MMWYSGEAKNSVDNIGLATSKDGVSWTRYGQQPVLSVGSPGQWDSGSVNECWVIQEGGVYKMWYSGQTINSTAILTYAIGYATSPDGIHWTKYPTNPIFSSAAGGSWDDKFVFRPMIIATGSSYTMYYRGENSKYVGQTGIATSTDGIDWTRKGTISPIPKGTWDAYQSVPTSIIATPGGYLMAYDGRKSQSSMNWYIGFASSTDGVNWTPYTDNPVVAPNVGAIAFDSEQVSYPMVITVGNQYYVYYTGYSGAIQAMGLAMVPVSQFPVPEFASTELLVAEAMLACAFVMAAHRHRKSARAVLDSLQ